MQSSPPFPSRLQRGVARVEQLLQMDPSSFVREPDEGEEVAIAGGRLLDDDDIGDEPGKCHTRGGVERPELPLLSPLEVLLKGERSSAPRRDSVDEPRGCRLGPATGC